MSSDPASRSSSWRIIRGETEPKAVEASNREVLQIGDALHLAVADPQPEHQRIVGPMEKVNIPPIG
jgi:hypothetical protein